MFELGVTVITRGANEIFDQTQVFDALNRHYQGDWGEICQEDREANKQALLSGERVMSVYTYGGEKMWVITEWDRSVTTVLLPEEY